MAKYHSLYSFRMMLTINSEKDMLESFKIFDSKHEKAITFQGLKDVLAKMGEKMSDDDIMNLIKEADEDGDGKVSF
jgi:calmodulin